MGIDGLEWANLVPGGVEFLRFNRWGSVHSVSTMRSVPSGQVDRK